MSDLPPILLDEGAFLAELEGQGSRIKGKTCTCPWHDDKTPSAQWSAGNDGVWRIYCHHCNRSGNLFDLVEHRTGRSSSDQFKDHANTDAKPSKVRALPPRKQKEPSSHITLATKSDVASFCQRLGEVAAWYKYGDQAAPVLVVARIHLWGQTKKSFLQFTPTPDGYVAKCLLDDGTIPLYGSHDLPPGEVLVVEGEKCVDACRKIGVAAVSSAMGAGKAHKSDWSALAGRRVVLWPDNDKTDAKTGRNPGREHMADVAGILRGLGCDLAQVDPVEYGLPEKGDVYDLIQAHSKEVDPAQTVRGIMEAADSLGASRLLGQRIEDIISGKFSGLDTPWPHLDGMTNWLIPGCVVSFCADPGAGKSLLLLQLVGHLLGQGIKAAVYMLEDQEAVHLQRALVQAAGKPELFDPKWVQAHPDESRELLATHRSALDQIGAALTAEGDKEISRADLLAWAEARAKAGARVVIIDPVTAAKTEREPWAADAIFVTGIKAIARKYQCSVIVTLHPRTTTKGPTLGGMAGGAAYPRFSHTVIWLTSHTRKAMPTGAGSVEGNRMMAVLKARNGKGTGLHVGMDLQGHNMRLADLGLVLGPDEVKEKCGKRGRPEPSTAPPLNDQERASRAARMIAKPSDDEALF
jgi:hypothetical protein